MARHLLECNIGNHTVAQLDEIFRAIDGDFWNGETHQGRFGWVLVTPTKNKILANDLSKLNRFVSEVYRNENIDKVDDLRRDLKSVGHGLASILLYLRKPEEYNVFLKYVSRALNVIYPDTPIGVDDFSRDYPRYNLLANRMKEQFHLAPQEVDVVLTELHRSETHEEIGAKTTKKKQVGIDLDYIPPILSDLPELAKNDPSIPDAKRKLEEKLWILGRMLGYDV